MKNTLILFSIFALAAGCSNAPPRRGGTAGTGVAGTTGAAGMTGTAGTTGMAGTTGAAGTTDTGGVTGTAGMAAAGTTGSAGTGGVTGTAGTAAAGTTGTAGTGGAGGATGAAGAGGTGGTVACTPGPTTGAAGGAGNACAHAMWTFTPTAICDKGMNAACGFCGAATTGTCAPKNAIDGAVGTRYTSGQTQIGGENFVLSFAAPVKITGVKVDSSGFPTDATTAYLAEYSMDGTTFFGWCPALAGPGGGATTDIVFPAAITVKAIRITETGPAADAKSWWSINEVTLDGCTAP
jgi:hypothetical protein